MNIFVDLIPTLLYNIDQGVLTPVILLNKYSFIILHFKDKAKKRETRNVNFQSLW